MRGLFVLTLRGIWFRRTASVAALAVAIVATAAAILGPLYARSAEDSLVREQLKDAPVASTTFVLTTSSAEDPNSSVDQLRTGLTDAAGTTDLGPWFGPVATQLSIWDIPVASGKTTVGFANLVWHDDHGCAGVAITAGACPKGDRDVMISSATAKDHHLGVGSRLRLLFGAKPTGEPVTVVGEYDSAAKPPPTWGLDQPAEYAPPPFPGTDPPHLDQVVMSDALMLTTRAEVHIAVSRPLVPDSVHVSDVAAIESTLEAIKNNPVDASSGISFGTSIPLLDLLASLNDDRALVRTAAFAVTAQLVLVALFVLFVIVGATMDERSSEIAIAKLRGLKPRSTTAYALSETTLLLTVALPFGLLLGWAVDVALTNHLLAAGTEVEVTPTVWLALLVAWLGGVVAAYGATRRTLRSPVLEQMRTVSGRRAQIARSITLETTAVVLAVVGAYELHKGGSDTLALLTPGALALAVGLLSVRFLPLLARTGVARTRRSPRVASFLAVRSLARRPAGLRLVSLLIVAVGLATFAVDAWAVAGQTREAQANLDIGAPIVDNVSGASPAGLLTAVRKVDPDGTWAMAAIQSDAGVIALDSPRFPAVTTWNGDGLGLSVSAAAKQLHPAAGPSLIVYGPLRFSAKAVLKPRQSNMTMGVQVQSRDGVVTQHDLGIVAPEARTFTAALPECEAGCVFEGFIVNLNAPVQDGAPVQGSGQLTVSDVQDAHGPVDLTSVEWRQGRLPPGVIAPDDITSIDPTFSENGFTAQLASAGPNSGILEPTDHPLDLPSLVSSGVRLDDFSQGKNRKLAPGIDGANVVIVPVGSPTLLPRVLDTGEIVDLQYSLRGSQTPLPSMRTYVWLGPKAPADATARLAKVGLTVVSTESVAARKYQLDRQGTALALGIFLIAALAAVILAGGALLTTTAAAARRRSYELAALRVLGAKDRMLVAAGRRELLALTVVGTVIGVICGLVGARLAIPAIPAVDGSGVLVHSNRGPVWWAVLAVAVAVLAVGWIVAQVSARRTLRLAKLDRLREGEG